MPRKFHRVYELRIEVIDDGTGSVACVKDDGTVVFSFPRVPKAYLPGVGGGAMVRVLDAILRRLDGPPTR